MRNLALAEALEEELGKKKFTKEMSDEEARLLCALYVALKDYIECKKKKAAGDT